jgi:L-ascorbate metabolism protein UlaG (beta-lactamase superfamily)
MRLLTSAFLVLVSSVALSPAAAQTQPVPMSQCLAIAQALPGATYANYDPGDGGLPVVKAQSAPEVEITFVGHSTYVVTTPAGVTVATDYNGWSGDVEVPRVVTMNRAHTTHYTETPDPRIEHVLPGWSDDGSPAKHDLVVEDLRIRNVTTDIRGYQGRVADGNSIFIFETANLCIGHLGHLHHTLDDSHFGAIGRLDIVMVPVDGGLTMDHAGMSEIVRRLRTSVVLPMHGRGTQLSQFIDMMGGDFATRLLDEDRFTISLATLPRQPTIMVPKGM